MKKKVAIIGTNGIPAKYGGFETLAEQLVNNLDEDYQFTVYCSKSNNTERNKYFRSARLLYIPFKANGVQSVIYDIICTIHALNTADVLIILGPAAGFILFINILFKKNIIVNHGGLNEWEREKYSLIEKKIIKFNHRIGGKYAKYNIADNYPLKQSLKKSFNIESFVIEYGGDHVEKQKIDYTILKNLNFLKKEYCVSVSRAQIDNNLHILLEAFKEMPNKNLVLISNWQISEYGKDLKSQYYGIANIYLVDAVYDKYILDVIRSNTMLYIHSHSRCGTSPSLVEAMNYDIPIICFDVETNRNTTNNKTRYFKTKDELIDIINNIDTDSLCDIRYNMYKIAKEMYSWKIISEKYKKLIK